MRIDEYDNRGFWVAFAKFFIPMVAFFFVYCFLFETYSDNDLFEYTFDVFYKTIHCIGKKKEFGFGNILNLYFKFQILNFKNGTKIIKGFLRFYPQYVINSQEKSVTEYPCAAALSCRMIAAVAGDLWFLFSGIVKKKIIHFKLF